MSNPVAVPTPAIALGSGPLPSGIKVRLGVTPRLAIANVVNSRARHAVDGREVFCGRTGTPDTPNNVSGKLLRGRRSVATLCNAILLVIAVSAEKEVSRVDAGRVVATVQNVQPNWDGTIRQRVAHPMREARLCSLEHPVAAVTSGAVPSPALGSFVNESPEPLLKGGEPPMARVHAEPFGTQASRPLTLRSRDTVLNLPSDTQTGDGLAGWNAEYWRTVGGG